jgi:glucose-1-phosphate thymidylyltransferase
VKVIIPLAGKGTRLLPLTRTVPKPLIRVAGRPVMDYLMDQLEGLDISELIFITGHLKEQVETYVRSHYRQPARFIEQKVQDGTAGAVALAKPYVDCPVFVIFVDTVFDADLTLITRADADGIMWVKEVEDYQRFGVVVTDANGYMTRIVEKPKDPISKLANIGLYYVRDHKALFDGIDWTLKRPANKGEFFLTDAFQHMINHRRKILTVEVSGWYDCGKVATILETQRHLLASRKAIARSAKLEGCTIVQPVLIEDDVVATGSTIGPNVTIGKGSTLSACHVSNAVLGDGVELTGCRVTGSLIGDGVKRVNQPLEHVVAAGDETAPAK